MYADHHVEKAYRAIKKHTKSEKAIQIVGGDFNDELGPGIGVERVSVGPHTLKEGNKRRDWVKQWMMLQKLVALNTMHRKTPEKHVMYRTPKGVEKQLDYVLINRKMLSCSRHAEANDMIHMGGDHRSVMAQFLIKAWTKETLESRVKQKADAAVAAQKPSEVGAAAEITQADERAEGEAAAAETEAQAAAAAGAAGCAAAAHNRSEDANAAAAKGQRK